MKRNAWGGLVAPEPGGYQREAGELYGIPLRLALHAHEFVWFGFNTGRRERPMRCRPCRMTRREAAEKEGA